MVISIVTDLSNPLYIELLIEEASKSPREQQPCFNDPFIPNMHLKHLSIHQLEDVVVDVIALAVWLEQERLTVVHRPLLFVDLEAHISSPA